MMEDEASVVETLTQAIVYDSVIRYLLTVDVSDEIVDHFIAAWNYSPKYPISSQEVKSRILELKQDLANYLQEKGIPGA